MYEAYWGLQEKPFENTPDPRFFYESADVSEVYTRLLYTIKSNHGAALLTGLLFAKVARPTSSVLFSEPMVIHEHNGKRTLSFRCGNAVVEAHLKLVVLREEITPEGAHLRRLHDVRLVRDNTPLFTVSWSVYHTIDEDSPFYGVTADNVAETVLMVIATMTGHDSTYASTTHARKFWYPEDVRFGHRFEDVIGSMDDGPMIVDYSKFHDTKAERASKRVGRTKCFS